MKNAENIITLKVLKVLLIILTCFLGLPSKTNGSIYYAEPDQIFGPNAKGIVTTSLGSGNSTSKALAVQPDGKVVVVGTSLSNNKQHCTLIRYLLDGKLDWQFGTNGIVVTDITGNNGSEDFARDVLIQPDGKILVAGFVPSISGIKASFVARYNSNGSLDSTFNFDGIFTSDSSFYPIEGKKLALQADGKIVVVGTYFDPSTLGEDLAIIRVNSNGIFDSSFNNSGIVINDISGTKDNGNAISIQSDGKIVVVGKTYDGLGDTKDNFAVLRYNVNGSIDSSFGSNGVVTTDFRRAQDSVSNDDFAEDIKIQPDGKLLVLGSKVGNYINSGNPFSVTAIARYTTIGALDQNFGISGKVIFSIDNADQDNPSTLALLSDGDFVTCGGYGFSTYGSDFYSINRFSVNGLLLSGYGGNDHVRHSHCTDVKIFNGKVISTGDFADHSNSHKFSFQIYKFWWYTYPRIEANFDFKNSVGYYDYRDNISVFRNGVYYILYPSGEVRTIPFGSTSNKPTPFKTHDYFANVGTFNGGFWNISNFGTVNFGLAGDYPIPGHYTPGLLDDYAVFRNGLWLIYNPYNLSVTQETFGTIGDKPVKGDFDGDNYTDFAFFRPSEGRWYIKSSIDGTVRSVQFGLATDKPVVGNYDGDNLSDIAVFRPSTGDWWILRSSDLSYYAVHFGISTDIPVPALYDEDNKTDIGVFRDGDWYILQSTSNSIEYTHFGQAGDIPIPSVYLP
jgi:uncharacterized delta-60 repeat protein